MMENGLHSSNPINPSLITLGLISLILNQDLKIEYLCFCEIANEDPHGIPPIDHDKISSNSEGTAQKEEKQW